MKYLSLTLLFCLMAFFSCEREDAYPDTHGPVEPIVLSEYAAGEFKSASILSDVSADIQILSVYLRDNVKDLSSITEADLEAAAAAVEVDLQTMYLQVQTGIETMNEQGDDPEAVALEIARRTHSGYLGVAAKLPCLEAYQREMISAIQRTVECVVVARGSELASLGCTATYIVLASVADNNFDKCLNRTYPNG